MLPTAPATIRNLFMHMYFNVKLGPGKIELFLNPINRETPKRHGVVKLATLTFWLKN
jgi:hypothetical protein